MSLKLLDYMTCSADSKMSPMGHSPFPANSPMPSSGKLPPSLCLGVRLTSHASHSAVLLIYFLVTSRSVNETVEELRTFHRVYWSLSDRIFSALKISKFDERRDALHQALQKLEEAADVYEVQLPGCIYRGIVPDCYPNYVRVHPSL